MQLFRETSRTTLSEEIPFPLAFRWGSALLEKGSGFDSLKQIYHSIDSSQEIVLVRGYYFRDEAADDSARLVLGLNRIQQTLDSLGIPDDQMMTEVQVQEITADVKTLPFEAVRFERLRMDELIMSKGDTLECCFPIADSITLPTSINHRIADWFKQYPPVDEAKLHIIGTASGTGIAEPMDMAMERALSIKQIALDNGWDEAQILLSTGQRNHPLTLRNRCVVLFIE